MAQVYDLETYPNFFLACIEADDTGQRWEFVCDDTRNDWPEFLSWLTLWGSTRAVMTGFNSVGFDYPVLHHLLKLDTSEATGVQIANAAYAKAMQIIQTPWDQRFSNRIWDTDCMVKQRDLFIINHFDNPAKSTSLKQIEFNMRMMNVQELPIPVGTENLTPQDKQIIIDYCWNDMEATMAFNNSCRDDVEFREHLRLEYGSDFTNMNDAKVGGQIMINRLKDAGVECYEYINKKKTVRQTKRGRINLGDVIFPYIQFRSPEFNALLDKFRSITIKDTRKAPEVDGMHVIYKGFKYDYGLGGIHGSVESQIIRATNTRMILDIDVTGFYPSLGIANSLYPEHLGIEFCDISNDVKTERAQYSKGTSQNLAMKMAGNATYGNSNNQYSPFFDSKYTMSITINGQLLLTMLAEWLGDVHSLRTIQANTDGLTIEVDRDQYDAVMERCDAWCDYTKLELEYAEYDIMPIRDVNNYMARTVDGKIKRKGAYEWNKLHHQDQSFLVVAKITEKVLLDDAPITDTLKSWPDVFDFMGRTKVPKSGRLMIDDGHDRTQVQNLSRYLVTEEGGKMIKILPPLCANREEAELRIKKLKNQPKDAQAYEDRVMTLLSERETVMASGNNVTICNNMSEIAWMTPINFAFYENKIQKLVMGLE